MERKELGLKVKQIREGLSLTLQGFGNLFTPAVNKGSISKWEKGTLLPSETRLKQLANIGGVSREYFEISSTNMFEEVELSLKNQLISNKTDAEYLLDIVSDYRYLIEELS